MSAFHKPSRNRHVQKENGQHHVPITCSPNDLSASSLKAAASELAENIDPGETTACNLAQTEHMQAQHRVVSLRGESESKSNEFPPTAPNAGVAGGRSVSGGVLYR